MDQDATETYVRLLTRHERDRRKAREECLGKLIDADRNLVAGRYTSGQTVRDLAEREGRPVQKLLRTVNPAAAGGTRAASWPNSKNQYPTSQPSFLKRRSMHSINPARIFPEKKMVSGLGKKKLASEIKAAAAELDAEVENALEKRGLKRNPEIDDATFLRRAYLELAGRNPSVSEAERFLKADSPDKRAILVEFLSDSDAYVSRHFNYWVKVLRGSTKQGGNEQDAWFHYLKKSIAENTRYDEWTREMMTAEGRMWDNPAIGFYQRDAKNRLAGYEAMTNVFLGTDIGCAQCHDHPTEPTSASLAARWPMRRPISVS